MILRSRDKAGPALITFSLQAVCMNRLQHNNELNKYAQQRIRNIYQFRHSARNKGTQVSFSASA